jgi:hypothetical protein
MEVTGSDKRTCLLKYGIDYSHKMFYGTGPRTNKLERFSLERLFSLAVGKVKLTLAFAILGLMGLAKITRAFSIQL